MTIKKHKLEIIAILWLLSCIFLFSNTLFGASTHKKALTPEKIERLEQAISKLTAQLGTKPKDKYYYQVYHNRGKYYRDLGKYEKAIEDLKSAIKANPEIFYVYSDLGNIYLDLERYSNAVEIFDRLIWLKPFFPQGYLNRAKSYFGEKQYVLARKDIEKTLNFKRSYTYPEAYSLRAKTYYMENNMPEFYSSLKTGVEKGLNIQSHLNEFPYNQIANDPKFIEIMGLSDEQIEMDKKRNQDYMEILQTAASKIAPYIVNREDDFSPEEKNAFHQYKKASLQNANLIPESAVNNQLLRKIRQPINPIATEVKKIFLSEDTLYLLKSNGSLLKQLALKRTIDRNLNKISAQVKWVKISDKVKDFIPETMILMEDGSLGVSGKNDVGQLGLGFFSDFVTKHKWYKTLDNVQNISGGKKFNLALKKNGDLYGTGLNVNGELGTGDKQNRKYWEKLLSNVKKIYAGPHQSYAIKEDHSLWISSISGWTKTLDNVESISGEASRIFALKRDGTLWGSESNQIKWRKILENVDLIKSDLNHSYALKTDGTLYCSGKNKQGVLGFSEEYRYKKADWIPIISDVIQIETSHHTSVVLRKNGTLLGTGVNKSNIVSFNHPNDFNSVIWGWEQVHNFPSDLNSIDSTYPKILLDPLLPEIPENKKNDYLKVMDTTNTILKSDPDRVDALYSRAKAHFALNKYGKAIADLNTSIAINKLFYRGFYLRGVFNYYSDQ